MAITSIRTVRIPATDKTGARIMATVRSGEFKGKQVTVPTNHTDSHAHVSVALALLTKLDIVGDVVRGSEHATGHIFAVVEPITPEAGTPIVETVDPAAPVQVVTRYVSPVNGRHARIGARMLSGEFEGKRVTVDYDYDVRDAHKAATHALMAKIGVDGAAVDSGAGIGNGYVYDIVN